MIFIHTILRYARAHPFSVMALSNIVGDSCYLGFAFAADHVISLLKLTGALATMLAHTLLLAYGDDQAARIANERGAIADAILMSRLKAQRIVQFLPQALCIYGAKKPIGVCFAILSLNGLALMMDAIFSHHYNSVVGVMQGMLGLFVALGTFCFSVADFVASQSRADRLTKMAPWVLFAASLFNIALAFLTLNPFMILSVVVLDFIRDW